MTERILVTGATGFAGGHLLDLLATRPGTVVAWGLHPPEPDQRQRAAAVTWQAVDVLDAAAVDRACRAARPDTVYHLAGAAHVASSWAKVHQTLAVNVRGTVHLLDAVRRHRPSARIVVTGSAAIYAPSPEALAEDSRIATSSPYGVSKLAQEQLSLLEARDGLDVVVARPFNHIGPGQSPDYVASSLARQIARIEAGLEEPRLLVGNLETERDLTDVRDTVRAYVRLAERGAAGRVYNVCTGTAVRVRDLAEALLERASLRIELVVDPGRFRPTDTPLVLGSCRRLADETGWTPEIPLATTLDDLLAWWRERIARA